MIDPFHIEGPAILSISGGRTSGYMLHRILGAHGGTLPEDVRPFFANTGKEMPETLDFVEEISQRWSVPITWVEYRGRATDGKKQHAIVDYKTASRNGEPFADLIADRKYLPNPVARFCTAELKIRIMHRVVREFGWEEWISCVGIRADEPRRIAKLAARARSDIKNELAIAPLASAGVSVAEVGAFWAAQPFDLRLPNMNGKTMHGNCDLCFLKGSKQVLALIREQPKRAIWWMEQEANGAKSSAQASGARFRSDRPSYAAMYKMAKDHGELFKFDDEPLQDCMCVD